MVYTKYTETDNYVAVPSHEGDEAITTIGAKAFLSCKQVEKLVLPASVTAIEDWAFAHMHHLKELEMPANPIRFGKQVFLDCHELRYIRLFPDASQNPGLPCFLANVAAIFPERLLSDRSLFSRSLSDSAFNSQIPSDQNLSGQNFSGQSLLDPVWAASETEHIFWMKSYDELLIYYLLENDLAGYEPVFYGWVDDEDADIHQKPEYLYKQRSNKVFLTFQRLTYDLYLADAHREILHAYLRDHMPWGKQPPEHTAVWDLLPCQYGQDVQYYHILKEAGALPTEHIPELIEHLSAAAPEVIAWLLRYQQENQEAFDFFDTLVL